MDSDNREVGTFAAICEACVTFKCHGSCRQATGASWRPPPTPNHRSDLVNRKQFIDQITCVTAVIDPLPVASAAPQMQKRNEAKVSAVT